MVKIKTQLPLLAILLLVTSMGLGIAESANKEREMTVTKKELSADLTVVRQSRILFSHHSVGANIISGIERLDAEVPGVNHIRVASLEEADTSKGPMLIHFSEGQNGWPKSKIDSFAATILRGKNYLKPDIAFVKLCYDDIQPRTDIDDLFSYYHSTFEALKREYPKIRFAHVTVPLKTWPRGLKQRVYRLIGREVWDDASNVKRAEFNRRLKETFAKDPIFDLAQVEATAPDGSLTTFEQGGKNYQSLYPGYTEDGGHLNILGQQVAGVAAIHFLAEALKNSSAAR